MTGAMDDGGGYSYRRDCDPAEHGEFKRLAARVANMEKLVADNARAGFAWAGHMVHGDAASVEEVRQLVEAGL